MPRRPLQRGGDVQVAVDIEGDALRPSQPAIELAHRAVGIDLVNGVEAGDGGTGDVEVPRGGERQVIGRDAGLERGKDVDLAVAGDLEDGSAAVADVEILFRIEGYTGGHAHALRVGCHRAVGRNAVHRAVVARGDVQVPGRVQRQAGGVHQFGNKGLDALARAESCRPKPEPPGRARRKS